ncbi:MAG: ribosomal-processing cysteine protease Prp [Candidatus Aphodocola sp.]
MIKVKVDYDDNLIKKVKVTGHAGYDDYGKDIVCASVSSIVITSVNLIYKLNKDIIKVIEDKGLIEINVLKEDKTINMVLKNMIDMLKELSNNYKKNVKII